MNAQDLLSIGTLLRDGKRASAYRLVEGAAFLPSNVDNINGISQKFGVTYSYGPHEDGRKYWKAEYTKQEGDAK